MKLSFDIISIIITFGIIQALFFAIAILNIKKENKQVNILLSIFLITTSIAIFGGVYYKTNLYMYLPHFARINEPFRLLVAPIFYFYVKELTKKNYKFSKNDFIHLLPFILNVFFLMPFYLKSSAFKLEYISGEIIDKQGSRLYASNQLFLIFMVIQVIIYMILIHYMLTNHKKNIRNTFSSIDKINLSWIRQFMIFFLILSFVIISLLIFSKFITHTKQMYRIIPVLIAVSLYSLAYRGIIQPQIFTQQLMDKENSLIDAKKYEKSSLTEEEANQYLKKLNFFMESNKPYLDQELTLSDLAVQVDIPQRYLSQIINDKLKQNFYNFINQYRLDEVKNFLTDPKNKFKSILEIAFDAGFNSKATFNAFFKQTTNLTPTQFRKINS